MALKAKLTADEAQALPEATRSFYRQAGDGFVLDAEGVEDVSGLKTALDKERDARRAAEKAAKDAAARFGDIDPEKAREALQRLHDLEDKNMLAAGQVDEVVAKRTERMRADYEAQMKRFGSDLETERAEKSKLSGRLSEVLIDSGLREAAVKAGVKSTALIDLQLRGRNVWKLKDGQPVPYRDDGTTLFGKNPPAPMTMDEWVASLQAEAPHLFETNKGAGSEPTNRQGTGGRITLTRDQARDVRTWRAAQDQASKSGAQVVVLD